MSLPSQTQVLVIGAGPCGLTCGITLASLGLQVTIVDALAAGQEGGRASVVNPRSLEVLDAIGLTKPLMDSGIQVSRFTFRGGLNKLIEFDIAQLRDETAFPLMLMISQHVFERIAEAMLASKGVTVFRNRRAVGLSEAPSAHGLEVSFEDGAVVRAQYVVGADGSRSTVRRLAGIDFQDPDTGIAYDSHMDGSGDIQIVLADVTFQEPLPSALLRNEPSGHLNKPFLLVPLRSSAVSQSTPEPSMFWRVIIVPIDSAIPPRHPDVDYVQNMIDEHNPWGSKLTLASVLAPPTTYRVRSAVASTLFKEMGTGNVLLIGDAAHVHSPFGGQGMNLGICDAVALGHAIRSHVDANATSEEEANRLLSAYSSSRRATAVKVIGLTKRFNSIVKMRGWRKMLRNLIFRIVGRLRFVGRIIVWRLSGLSNRDV